MNTHVRMNTKIYAAEKSFDIGCKVVKWDELNGFNFIPSGNFKRRNLSFSELSPLMKQFAIHWSATYKAAHTFNGLNARQLSCNFIIDDDNVNGFATIYQCLPIEYSGWSQGTGLNDRGPGVEISYMPNAWEGDCYTVYKQNKWGVPGHDMAIAPVHGTTLKVHLPTKAQIASLLQLIWGFVSLFPNVPAKFPRTNQGFPMTTKLSKPEDYVGLVNHYHLKREKIDTAGLDMEMIEAELAKRQRVGF